MITRRASDCGLFDEVGFTDLFSYGRRDSVGEQFCHRPGHSQVAGKICQSGINVSGFLRCRVGLLLQAEESDLFTIEAESASRSISIGDIDGHPIRALLRDFASGTELELLAPDLVDIVTGV